MWLTSRSRTGLTLLVLPRQPILIGIVVTGHVVVASVEATDGAGGMFTTTYTYNGATENLEGRGFMGFEKIESVDLRNNIKHVQKFAKTFPKVGMLIEDTVYQPGGSTPISSQTVTLAQTNLDSTTHNERYFPYVSASTEDVHEVGGQQGRTADQAYGCQ